MRTLLGLVIPVAIAASSTPSYAGDSAWLLCKGTAALDKPATKIHVVVSLLEHRGADAKSRDLSVTLLKGANEHHGDVRGKDVGDLTARPFKLKLTTVFAGTATLSEDFKSFAMTGTIDPTFGGDRKTPRVAFTARFVCDELDDLALRNP